jgi:hypothetical protein
LLTVAVDRLDLVAISPRDTPVLVCWAICRSTSVCEVPPTGAPLPAIFSATVAMVVTFMFTLVSSIERNLPLPNG